MRLDYWINPETGNLTIKTDEKKPSFYLHRDGERNPISMKDLETPRNPLGHIPVKELSGLVDDLLGPNDPIIN